MLCQQSPFKFLEGIQRDRHWPPGRHRFVLALGHKLCAVVMRFVQIANKLQDASERRTEKKKHM